MRLPRVRFTVRRMMVAVAIAAAGMAIYPLGAAAKRYRERAREEEFRELNCIIDFRGCSPAIDPA